MNRIRDETDAQIDVDREDDGNQSESTTIRLRGTKQAIAAAKVAVLAVAADVDSEASYSLHIPSKFHGQLIGPGGQNLRDIIAAAGGPSDSKSATQLIQFPRRGAEAADIVTVRGPAELAAKVKTELERIVEELNDRIVVGVVVAPSQQRMLMGRIRELQAVHKSAKIIVPGWKEYNQLEISNGDQVKDAAPESIVKVQGSKEDCKALQAEIADSFASHSKKVEIPRGVAQRLAGGAIFRHLRNEFGVSVDSPRNASGPAVGSPASKPEAPTARIDADEEDADGLPFELSSLSLSSAEGSVTWSLTCKSVSSLEEAAKELEREVTKLKSFTTQGRLWVDQKAVPRIIGRGGAGLREIESQTDTLIEIPRDQGGLVTIQGSEESVLQAKDRIVKITNQRNRD